MARGRKAVGRMEKAQFSQVRSIAPGATFLQGYQLDGGEVEAQVKRIMLSFGVETGKLCTFQLGLFQKAPTTAGDFDDETVVISGAIGNQFAHNETITMRCPKDWVIGLLIENGGTSPADLVYSLQLNYKVMN